MNLRDIQGIESTGLDDQLALGGGDGGMEGGFQNFGLGDCIGTWYSFIHSTLIKPPIFIKQSARCCTEVRYGERKEMPTLLRE